MKKMKRNKIKSKCCKAKIYYLDFFPIKNNLKTIQIGTVYVICTKCNTIIGLSNENIKILIKIIKYLIRNNK